MCSSFQLAADKRELLLKSKDLHHSGNNDKTVARTTIHSNTLMFMIHPCVTSKGFRIN